MSGITQLSVEIECSARETKPRIMRVMYLTNSTVLLNAIVEASPLKICSSCVSKLLIHMEE